MTRAGLEQMAKDELVVMNPSLNPATITNTSTLSVNCGVDMAANFNATIFCNDLVAVIGFMLPDYDIVSINVFKDLIDLMVREWNIANPSNQVS